jgi:biofilm protein TabA
MAIFGKFSTVKLQLLADHRFQAALPYVEQALRANSPTALRIGALGTGLTERIDLNGGSFALEQVYAPRLRADGFFESHRKYIDVQVMVAGEELMEVQDISRLVVSDPYAPERDFVKYADATDTSVLKMRTGDVAVFFPEDGHMPSLRWRHADVVRKTVVKVPVALA